ncbi:MAG TPA: hypothetical protein VJ738_19575 [Steroidobacteraceae bacterium]|nr:hypothetical protein [Steroidobacteraceae bacterium]
MNEPWLRNGPVLKDPWDNISEELRGALREIGELDVAKQFASVMVPLQGLKGSENEFSFMAYPVPRLDREQREKMAVRDFRSVTVGVRSGRIRIDLDVFGQINWFYVYDLPELYHQLQNSMAGLR